jgi:hypothetical protein
MEVIGSRRRSQPAPPWAIFDDLCEPNRQPCRPWLHLRWTLYVDEPVPDAALIGLMCRRIGQLINADLRYTYGQ